MYIIKKTDHVFPLGIDVQAPPWNAAESLEIAQYPWYKTGERQPTWVRALYNETSLFLAFTCQDKHSFAKVTKLNGPVCTDSCVEFFATPEPQAKPDYFNLEVNCCGTLLVGSGPNRKERTSITPELAERIGIWTSYSGETKKESSADQDWSVHVELPFDLLQEFAGTPRPAPGTIWKANFYRCGGKTDAQFAAWADIQAPKPDFHRPEFFQEIKFE